MVVYRYVAVKPLPINDGTSVIVNCAMKDNLKNVSNHIFPAKQSLLCRDPHKPSTEKHG